MAYDRLSPLNRGEYLLAQLIVDQRNIHRDPKTTPQAYRIEQFVWDPSGPDPAEQRRMIAEGYQQLWSTVARRRAERAKAN